MIDVSRARAALAAVQGDLVTMPKAQYFDMLAEVARGNAARITLINARSILDAGAAAAASHP